MERLDPGDDLTPKEHVKVIKQEYRDGKVSLLLDLVEEDKKRIRSELDPYMMKDLGFTTLVVWKKPIGVEFRTKISNLRSSNIEEVEQDIKSIIPGSKDTEVNVTFLPRKERAVINIPYKDDYREHIGLFIQPWIMETVEKKGGSDQRKKIAPVSQKMESAICKVLKDESSCKELKEGSKYEINEMTNGSLVHKTREAGRYDGTYRVDRPW